MTGPAGSAPDLDTLRVRVEPGEHLVVRLPGLVAVIAASADPQRSSELLEILRGTTAPAAARPAGLGARPAGPGGQPTDGQPGDRLAGRLADWLAAAADTPPFGIAAGIGGRLTLLLHGDVHASLDGGMKPDLSGHEADGLVERSVPFPAATLRLTVGEPHPVNSFWGLPPWAGLQAGVTLGGGLTLEVDRPATGTLPAVSEPPRPAPQPTEPLLAQRIHGAAVDERREPLPIAGAQPRPSQRERNQEAVEQARLRPGAYVRGFRCSRGHLNDPRVSFCGVCGIRMDQLTGILVFERRPPLGLFVLDAGTTFVLDDNYVVGRAPEVSEKVRSGGYRPIKIDDPSGATSRVHSEVRLVDWDVLLVDLGSANGTYVAGARDVLPNGAPRWTRLVPQQPYLLAPGTSVLIGRRQFVYESASARL